MFFESVCIFSAIFFVSCDVWALCFLTLLLFRVYQSWTLGYLEEMGHVQPGFRNEVYLFKRSLWVTTFFRV